MHYRFKGNPNTNNAGRLMQINSKRAAAGLPLLTLAEFEGKAPAPAPKAQPLPAVRVKLPRKMF